MGYAVVYEQGQYSDHTYGVDRVFTELQSALDYMVNRATGVQTGHSYHWRVIPMLIDDATTVELERVPPTGPSDNLGYQKLIEESWRECWTLIQDPTNLVKVNVVHLWHRWAVPVFTGTVQQFYDNDITFIKCRYSNYTELCPLFIHDRTFDYWMLVTNEPTALLSEKDYPDTRDYAVWDSIEVRALYEQQTTLRWRC